MEITHRPKGSMCMNCKTLNESCPKPGEFKNMKKIGQDRDGMIVVRCTNFSK